MTKFQRNVWVVCGLYVLSFWWLALFTMGVV